MARYDYNWSCGGCGSGTSCSFTILRDGVQVRTGTTQVSGSVDCTAENQRGAIVGIVPYGATDIAFSNGVQFYPAIVPGNGSSSSSGIIMLALAAVAVFLLFGKKGK